MSVNAGYISLRRRPAEPSRSRRAVRSRGLRGELTVVFRRAILDAAERVIGTQGFTRARMAEIASEAGLAAGTLYNYFASKQAIFRAVLDDRTDQLLALLAPIARERGGGQLQRLLATTFEYVEEHGGLMLQAAESAWQARSKREAGGGARQYLRCLAIYEECLAAVGRDGLLRSRLPSGEQAAALAGAMGGLVRSWLMNGRSGRLADRAQPLADLFVGAPT
jgi:AcrR family transcriptional regulator